jgi:peptide methionine sulfoxide reductase msrA/msrB
MTGPCQLAGIRLGVSFVSRHDRAREGEVVEWRCVMTRLHSTGLGNNAGVFAIALATMFLLAGCVESAENATAADTIRERNEELSLKELTPEEEAVIVHKGTERPFSGEYYDHHEVGTYVCRQCGAPLYRSTDKFDSGCGWPSFDDEIPGAVRRVPDADGRRTEILCAACGGHLGHVFEGERLTDKNVRHCVNSISLDFVSNDSETELRTSGNAGGNMAQVGSDTNELAGVTEDSARGLAYFAGGCFWGVEHLLQQEEGVFSVRSGYMGGKTENPSYRQVCSGKTGHAETVEVEYDPSVVSYETLAKLFFEIHDPTQGNRQGPDVGSQYRSAVFYADEEQKKTAEKLIGILRDNGYDVTTEVSPAGTFWEAEDYHQDYYETSGKRPYCHARQKRF